MKRTYSQIDLDERRKIARRRTAGLSVDVTCGTGAFYFLQKSPDIIAVPVNLFAGSQFPSPRFSVYESRQHAWVDIR
ncbi:hypothetical protein C8J32_10344 [Rhizobium sp. PP-CC-3A-592]|nr:hypothetical protein C8J32_10344 [Rhizobium sp. PP-CC-3A-592]